MSSRENVKHGLAVCENCESVQPVEVHPDEELQAVGNPTCQCGENQFRLLG